MWNLHDDNELDNLSRDAAEGYSMDRSPDSWSKLHARLDAEMPEQRRRRYLLFFLLFLFIGSGLFWVSRMNTADADEEVLNNNVAETNGSKVNNPNTVDTESAIQKNATFPKPPVSTVEEAKSENIKEAPVLKPDLILDHTLVNPNNKSRDNVSQKSSEPVIVAATSGRSSSVKNKRDRHVSKSVTASGVDGSKKSAIKNPEAEDVTAENNVSSVEKPLAAPVAEERKVDQPSEQKVEKKEDQVNQQSNTDPIEKSELQKSNSRWIFSAAYAPDISTVNFTHTQSPGLNLGVFIDYKLSNRWLLQGGIIYTKKNYKMMGEDFHPPKGGWFDHVKLEDVTGSCYMIDFPLNVRYNAIHKRSFNVFAGAGLSSYLMKKEEYSYYGYYYGNPVNSSRTYEGNEGYILSILNISVGYEKKLSNAFSMQVEPFFKQTLKGVGFGDISLNSTGVYFSLRYNPVKIQHTNKTASKKSY